MTRAAASRGPSRSLVSLLLSWVDRHASRPPAAVFVVTVAGAWIIVSVVAGFPARWETIFQTVVAALTLAMVFVIQHSQARHQRATQRKLDEILLAIPGTDNALLTLEHASGQRPAGDAQDRLKATLTQVPSGPDTMLIRSATCRTSHNPCPGALDIELIRVLLCVSAAPVAEPAGCRAGSSDRGGSPSSTWQHNSLTRFQTRSRPAPAPWRMALAASS